MNENTANETSTSSILARGRASAFFGPSAVESQNLALQRAAEGRAYLAASQPAQSVPEESLVVDGRSDLTPAQMVEGKLMDLLKGGSLAVSHLQIKGLVRGRRED